MNESGIKAAGFTAVLVRAKTVNALANTSILHCLIKYEVKKKKKKKRDPSILLEYLSTFTRI